jgi:hypothetical protein
MNYVVLVYLLGWKRTHVTQPIAEVGVMPRKKTPIYSCK